MSCGASVDVRTLCCSGGENGTRNNMWDVLVLRWQWFEISVHSAALSHEGHAQGEGQLVREIGRGRALMARLSCKARGCPRRHARTCRIRPPSHRLQRIL